MGDEEETKCGATGHAPVIVLGLKPMASRNKPPREHARDVLSKFGNERHTAEEFLNELHRRGFTVHRDESPSGIGGL